MAPGTRTLASAPWRGLVARVTGWRAAVGARGILTALGSTDRWAVFLALIYVCKSVGRAEGKERGSQARIHRLLVLLPVPMPERSLNLVFYESDQQALIHLKAGKASLPFLK